MPRNQGRRSYWIERIEPRLKEIEMWCRDGLTNKEIAELLDVGVSTFLKYKALKKELVDALKLNKQIADLQVENALRKRALGYEYYEEITEGNTGPDGEIVRTHKKRIKKQVPPDVTAQIFWLKNRQPEKWRDKRQTEITGKDGRPIQMSRAEYRDARAEMLEKDDC